MHRAITITMKHFLLTSFFVLLTVKLMVHGCGEEREYSEQVPNDEHDRKREEIDDLREKRWLFSTSSAVKMMFINNGKKPVEIQCGRIPIHIAHPKYTLDFKESKTFAFTPTVIFNNYYCKVSGNDGKSMSFEAFSSHSNEPSPLQYVINAKGLIFKGQLKATWTS